MTKWIFGLVPMTALIATTAFAAPIWYTKGYETGVRGRVTDVDRSGTQVVIENRDRVYVPPTADIAMADVRPGEAVDARYVHDASGAKSMLSIVPALREAQEP